MFCRYGCGFIRMVCTNGGNFRIIKKTRSFRQLNKRVIIFIFLEFFGKTDMFYMQLFVINHIYP